MESRKLAAARQHLSRAETEFRSADGLAHLEEGLGLLEEIMLDGGTRDRAIAANLLSTYANRICESTRQVVEGDAALPEPQLEHLFKVLLAFDTTSLEPPEYVRALKLGIARRLVDFYYEGYSAEEKEKVLRQLTNIADTRN